MGRENDFVTLNLAIDLRNIFIRSTGKKPKIYKTQYSDSGYGGNLHKFADRISEIFQTKAETNLYAKLLTANKFHKSNQKKE